MFWNLPEGTEILNVMGTEGLAANLFRITQADAKLTREKVTDGDTALLIHHDVGQEVRHAIERIHQQVPENLPRAADLRNLLEEKRRNQRKHLGKQKQIDESGQETLF